MKISGWKRKGVMHGRRGRYREVNNIDVSKGRIGIVVGGNSNDPYELQFAEILDVTNEDLKVLYLKIQELLFGQIE